MEPRAEWAALASAARSAHCTISSANDNDSRDGADPCDAEYEWERVEFGALAAEAHVGDGQEEDQVEREEQDPPQMRCKAIRIRVFNGYRILWHWIASNGPQNKITFCVIPSRHFKFTLVSYIPTKSHTFFGAEKEMTLNVHLLSDICIFLCTSQPIIHPLLHFLMYKFGINNPGKSHELIAA